MRLPWLKGREMIRSMLVQPILHLLWTPKESSTAVELSVESSAYLMWRHWWVLSGEEGTIGFLCCDFGLPLEWSKGLRTGSYDHSC